MDCCICTSMPYMLRPPRKMICETCYDGANNLKEVLSKPETIDKKGTNKGNNSQPNSCKSLMDVWRVVNDIKSGCDNREERLKFLSEFVAAFRDKIHPDILLKPSNDGPPIPAHKALLAVRSVVLKNMLDSEHRLKAPPTEMETLSELKHDELETLLEFLYNGVLSEEKMKRHVYALSLAADKYYIPYLRKICERHMDRSLCLFNAMNILEIADVCSYTVLKAKVLAFFVENLMELVHSSDFYVWSLKNPHLTVQIMRTMATDSKNKRF
ncbi:BTB/POZ domain-containing protein At3g56230 [Humulus lupulus]|uniref:BTB/POZ domain-containing protein At3g56230 n=1 Tax=Humulus lupulus TaxID=3486 RepID=UPI002B411273|nr:BTB/POZ domain-containing protein At3g56230 [Humulus lupulus]